MGIEFKRYFFQHQAVISITSFLFLFLLFFDFFCSFFFFFQQSAITFSWGTETIILALEPLGSMSRQCVLHEGTNTSGMLDKENEDNSEGNNRGMEI